MVAQPHTESPAAPPDALHVSEEQYLAEYAEQGYEWVEGELIAMSPIHIDHFELVAWLLTLFKAYFALSPIGRIVGEPFVLRLDPHSRKYREPDLMVILNSNPNTLTGTQMLGAPDICIEIVSENSITRDYRDKLSEYEKGGVNEYWLFDPLTREARFHRLQPNGLYAAIALDDGGNYRTPLLPRFALPAAALWAEPRMNILAVVEQVKAWFQDPA